MTNCLTGRRPCLGYYEDGPCRQITINDRSSVCPKLVVILHERVAVSPSFREFEILAAHIFPWFVDSVTDRFELSVLNVEPLTISPTASASVASNAKSAVSPNSRSKMGLLASFFCTVTTAGEYPGTDPTAYPH